MLLEAGLPESRHGAAKVETTSGGFQFNPMEIGVCGPNGSGKTTLVARLVDHFSEYHRVGYVKHAHGFEMDREGKDTARARHAGAFKVMALAPGAHAVITEDDPGRYQGAAQMLDADLVFIEGYKDSPCHKLVVIDERGELLPRLSEGGFAKVLAVVGPGPRPPLLGDDYLYFQRDDVVGLAGVVQQHLQAELRRRPLYGLVLHGREGSDTETVGAGRKLSGGEEVERVADLLANYCSEVFVSAPAGSVPTGDSGHYARIEERFLGFGPRGRVLSALVSYPGVAWLVAACDEPTLQEGAIEALLAGRNPYRSGTVVSGPADGAAAPRYAVCEPKCVHDLLRAVALGNGSHQDLARSGNFEFVATS